MPSSGDIESTLTMNTARLNFGTSFSLPPLSPEQFGHSLGDKRNHKGLFHQSEDSSNSFGVVPREAISSGLNLVETYRQFED